MRPHMFTHGDGTLMRILSLNYGPDSNLGTLVNDGRLRISGVVVQMDRLSYEGKMKKDY